MVDFSQNFKEGKVGQPEFYFMDCIRKYSTQYVLLLTAEGIVQLIKEMR